MAASDAFVVVGDWISEHFFTSDATKESFRALVATRRKEWDAEDAPTSRTRFTSARAEIERRLGSLSAGDDAAEASSGELVDDLLEVLGYRTGEFSLVPTGPVTRVTSTGIAGRAPLAIVRARPAETVDDAVAKDEETLAEPYETEDGEVYTSTARALSALFVAEDGPDFALVFAGRWCLVAERTRWAEGRYLGIDLQLVAERNDAKRAGEIDRALTCLEAASLAPDVDGGVWWAKALEDSVKHTVGVSEDLREGVRRSIEIIANEVVSRRAAQGLVPLPAGEAQPLAVQSLRYLYRILFLLYAEASPELGVLPSGAAEYDAGYSVDRLRELTLVELTDTRAQSGTHLYDSIRILTDLIERGPRAWDADSSTGAGGLDFQPLRADLFRPEATAHIDEVGLGNAALQEVLTHLLLSKERKGRDRGFISYAELGINQLGAVYEGLMSYTGFFAEDDLYEVAPNGDPSKGSWVVPVHRADHLEQKDFVRTADPVTGERQAVVHRRGTFVYRLSGRERQQSASYYTPEVLTRFTVQQALDELLDQDGHTTTAEEILGLTVCEPALGSGAFAIEAVDQLAKEYLTRRQAELGEQIDPEDYPRELQKVKAHIALHQVYGVDLNSTAVELAEISLWLSTMTPGLQAPWFGLRLRRGNSLIGARRATYAAADLRAGRQWMKAVPQDRPLADGEKGLSVLSGHVFHFLLPSEGWGSGVEAPKLVRDLVPDEVKALKTWRSQVKRTLTTTQVKKLVALSQRVEKLWALALRRLTIAEQQSDRDLDLWGRAAAEKRSVVTREQIEESLADENGAYRRLRRVMDAWCAMWFWPLTETDVAPPGVDEWIDALEKILGVETTKRSTTWMSSFAEIDDWAALDGTESMELTQATVLSTERVVSSHPWLAVAERVATAQGFFHWELDFAAVFARGGFDLQVGNPPWVRPRTDVEALLAEGDPWWQLAHKPSVAQKNERRPVALAVDRIRDLVVSSTADVMSTAEMLSSTPDYPLLSGQPDLYRAFMCQVWRHASQRGASALIHPESHFTDDKTVALRKAAYRRMRRHWQFFNELMLFDQNDDKMKFGVHIYQADGFVEFLHASALYHPETVTRSLAHDGSGEEPGFKHQGKWDQRPHASRIQRVDSGVLALWSAVTDPDASDVESTRMLYTVNSAATRVLRMTSDSPRVGALSLSFSRGWDESIDRSKGRFEQRWGEASWGDAILQGPHFHVGNPFFKSPNATMKHNQDWTEIDLESLSVSQMPVTSYKPAGDRAEYDAQYTRWGDEREYSARNFYRVAWRAMAANTGERTLIPAIAPPGAAHVNGVFALGSDSSVTSTVAATGVMSTLISDFGVRAAPKSGIYPGAVNRLPMVRLDHPSLPSLILRTLQLNCLTDAYADLWADCWDGAFLDDAPILERYGKTEVAPLWSAATPLRRAEDRRNAQVEIDALVALMLGVDVEDLCTIYRTTFAVLYGYDQDKYTFDVNGRQVPQQVLSVWKKKGERITQEERTAVHPGSGVAYEYTLPFATRDREEDFRTAYAEFARRLENVDF